MVGVLNTFCWLLSFYFLFKFFNSKSKTDGDYPKLLTMQTRKEITIETVCLLNQILNSKKNYKMQSLFSVYRNRVEEKYCKSNINPCNVYPFYTKKIK